MFSYALAAEIWQKALMAKSAFELYSSLSACCRKRWVDFSVERNCE